MAQRIYLDKISTCPHLPDADNFRSHNQTKVFPDMNHTGIPCSFGRYKENSLAPDGRIPKTTRSNVIKKNRTIERDRLSLESRERLFVSSHKQFMNNVLADLQRTKSEKDSRRDELWGSTIQEFNSVSGGRFNDESALAMTVSSRKVPIGFKKKRACNRSDIITCLLDCVDPPKTPKDWFGTLPRESERSASASASAFGSPASSPVQSAFSPARSPPRHGITEAGQIKWEAESIFKAIHGSDKGSVSGPKSGVSAPRSFSPSPSPSIRR